MLPHLLTGLTLVLGMAFAGSNLFGTVAAAPAQTADCCAQKLACCEGEGSACCTAETKRGCCEKGLKCCAENRACCTEAQECCQKAEACCEAAKACCGPKTGKAKTVAACCLSDKALKPADIK